MTTTDTGTPIRKPAPTKRATKASAKPSAPKASVSRSKEPSKIEKVLSLLKRSGGATLAELVQATGWLPHTTRAALTGLKKKGHTIERTKTDGLSRYTLAVKAAQ